MKKMGAESSCESYSYESYTTNNDNIGAVSECPALDSNFMSQYCDTSITSISGHSSGGYVSGVDAPVYAVCSTSTNDDNSENPSPSNDLVLASSLTSVLGPSHNLHSSSKVSLCAYNNTGTTNAERGAYEYGHLKGFDDAICGTTDVSKDNGASYLLPATTQHGNKGYKDGYEEARAGLDISNQLSQRSPPSSPPNSPGRDFRAE